MNSQKQNGKRGRPRRKVSQGSSSGQSFSQKKPGKKTKKIVPQSLKKTQSQKRKTSKLHLKMDSDSDEDILSDSSKNGAESIQNIEKITLQPFKSDKVFAQILNRANKQPQFLTMLKNLLSGCFRSIQDKKMQIKRKWKQLRNSNCTQDQYLSRQAQLKKMETEVIKQMQEDTMHKLSSAGIKGFETKEGLIETYKQNRNLGGQYIFDELSWQKYHDEQFKLLNLLMKQNDFVSQDYNSSGLIKSYTDEKEKNKQPTNQQNQNDIKLNSLQTQENQTQFLFCKHYKDINFDKIFDSNFKIHQNQKFYMDTKAMAWLLQSKCDQIYTNEKFQKETYKLYIEKLQTLYNKPQQFTNKQIIDDILQLTAYVLNSVHYYQKFKLKCQLLHPLDLLLVVEKLIKDRTKIQAQMQ